MSRQTNKQPNINNCRLEDAERENIQLRGQMQTHTNTRNSAGKAFKKTSLQTPHLWSLRQTDITQASYASCDPDETPLSPCKQCPSHFTAASEVQHTLHSHTFKDNDLNYSQAHTHAHTHTSITVSFLLPNPHPQKLCTHTRTHILKSSSIMSKKNLDNNKP